MAHIPRVISDTMNSSLLKEFMSCEVEQAIKQMAPSKFQGPDGMPPIFYQKHWQVMGPDVIKGVLSCLN